MSIKAYLLAAAIGITSGIAMTSAEAGVMIGGSIDGGHISCEDRNGNDCGNGVQPAGGFSFHIGGKVAPHVALLGELWGMGHTEDNVTASQVLATFDVRAWVAPRLWLQGGLGFARSKIEVDYGNVVMSSESDTVPAIVGAIGVDIMRSRNFALDIELRGGSGLYRGDARVDNAALGIGATWR